MQEALAITKRLRSYLTALRSAAWASILAGAAGSFGFMLYAGRRNRSVLLLVLFAGWVLSPFVALLWAQVTAKRWPAPRQMVLYCVTLLIAATSLAIYGYIALGPPRAQAASAFVVVPPVSWLLAGMGILMSALRPRRQ